MLILLPACVPPPPPPVTETPLIPTALSTITPIPTDPIRGLAYSPYRDCQSSDSSQQPGQADITQDLTMISHMANAIRTYSTSGVNKEIPALAVKSGLRVSAGAWLGPDRDANEREILNLIQLAQTVDLESVIVGNEVLLRGDLSEAELISYIDRVNALVDVPVTTAEIGGIFLQHPNVISRVDYVMVHLYPFWEGQPIDGAAEQVAQSYHEIERQVGGKRVVIGETGWPSGGPNVGAAIPNPENQTRFAKEFIDVALKQNIEFYYFDAFDEMWKTEGGVGPYWGLLRSDRTFKSDIESVMTPFGTHAELPGTPAFVQVTAQPTFESPSVSSEDFHILTNYGSPSDHFSPSGWMGDPSTIDISCYTEPQTWPATTLRIHYSPSMFDEKGWAGVYWLQPKDNWGIVKDAGYDLHDYKQLVFQARAEKPGTQIKFLVGGVSEDEEKDPLPYPSSIQSPVFALEADPVDGFVNLTDSWQEYHIDLSGVDLSNVIDGFGWAAERARTPDGAVFYLDNIRFVTQVADVAGPPPIHIYSGTFLRDGLDMGVASSAGLHNWVQDLDGAMRVSYAGWQDWGVVYITVGASATSYGHRSSMDFGSYQTLSIEMRGEQGGEIISIGIKDKNQLDNGDEPKIPVQLTNEWELYTFNLTDFYPDKKYLGRLFIPVEFVFTGGTKQDQVIYFRNIQYLP